jgi:riboflavin kinase
MDPGPLDQQLQQLPQGVYFGWAQLTPAEGSPAADAAVHKMVMNVGRRPTVNTGAAA